MTKACATYGIPLRETIYASLGRERREGKGERREGKKD